MKKYIVYLIIAGLIIYVIVLNNEIKKLKEELKWAKLEPYTKQEQPRRED
jgi:hypothetical protein